MNENESDIIVSFADYVQSIALGSESHRGNRY